MWNIIKKFFSKPKYYEYEVFGNIVSSNVEQDDLLKSLQGNKVVTVIYNYKSRKKITRFFDSSDWVLFGNDILKNRKNIRVIV